MRRRWKRKANQPEGRISSLLISIFHWVLYINELFQGVIARRLSSEDSRPQRVYAFIQRASNTWKQASLSHKFKNCSSTSGNSTYTTLRHFLWLCSEDNYITLNTWESLRGDLYLHQGCYGIKCVRLLVGLSAGLHKNYETDFHEACVEDGSRPSIDPIKFWCRSG